ncbi:MAG: hypothetical protein JWP74_222 [Marmoricola sp.]|nr:hypothetical protein [Marmoricola sp.]
MKRSSRLIAAAVIAVTALFTLTACTTLIDHSKVEKAIKKYYEKQSGTTVKSVKCPSDVKSVKGKTFKCSFVTGSGAKGVATVTVKDTKGNVHFDITSIPEDLSSAAISKGIKDDFASQNPKYPITSVTCPDKIDLTNGATTACTIALKDGESVTATVSRDASGAVTWKYSQN